MAAAGGRIQCLCVEATCSICRDYLKDPVTVPECGHNFCRSCFIHYFCWESEAEASCPQCRERVQRRSLISNQQLANMVDIAKNLSLQEREEEEEGKEKVCEKHQEPLKLFCKEDEAPICVVCDRSKEHKAHKVIPLEEAFQEYKRLFYSHLEILRKERENILSYQADTEKESQDLLKLTEMEKLKAVEKLRQLRQFLAEEEECLLNHLEEMEDEIEWRREEELAKYFWELSSLEKIIQDIEKKCEQPASELLEDIGSTLEMYRYKQRDKRVISPTFSPELRNRILESCDLNPLVEDIMKQWKDALLFRKQLQKANVILDPDTAWGGTR